MRFYQGGISEAFHELYRRHSRQIYGYLCGRMPTVAEADEIFQISFLKFHQHRDKFDASLPFLPWMFSIVRNSVADYYRQRRELPVKAKFFETISDDADSVAATTMDTRWQIVLGLLPPDQSELMRLRYEQGLSFEEIARRIHLSEAGVRKRISRIVSGLKRLIGTQEVG